MNLNCLPSSLWTSSGLKWAWKSCLPAEEPPWSEHWHSLLGKVLGPEPHSFSVTMYDNVNLPWKVLGFSHAPPCHTLRLTAALLFSLGKCYFSVSSQEPISKVKEEKQWEIQAHEASHFSVLVASAGHGDRERVMCTGEKLKVVGPQEGWTEAPFSPW